jgi:hypothetical protein
MEKSTATGVALTMKDDLCFFYLRPQNGWTGKLMNQENNVNVNASKKCSTSLLRDARVNAVKTILRNPDISTWAREHWTAVLAQIQ